MKKKDKRYERLLITLEIKKDMLILAPNESVKKILKENIEEVQQLLNEYK